MDFSFYYKYLAFLNTEYKCMFCDHPATRCDNCGDWVCDKCSCACSGKSDFRED